jgi:hypothetical protein
VAFAGILKKSLLFSPKLPLLTTKSQRISRFSGPVVGSVLNKLILNKDYEHFLNNFIDTFPEISVQKTNI